MSSANGASVDARVARTRTALQRAFTTLFFSNAYDRISVSDIAERAEVGRSTFYEHYENKEGVLWASMSFLFSSFAEAVSSPAPPKKLLPALEHLWQNRRFADPVFTGAPRRIISRALSAEIETRLKEMARRRRPLIPPRLAATQIAEAQLVLVDAWLRGKAACAPEAMCAALHASSRANARALLFGLKGDPA